MSSFKKNSLSIIAILTLTACSSSSVQKYPYSANSSPQEEISLLEQQLQNAKANQLDVLSPGHYHEAQEKIKSAKKTWSKNGKTEDVLQDLGYAKAHLNEAMTVGDRANQLMPEVVKSRSQALDANMVQYYGRDSVKADDQLRKHTSALEKGKVNLSVKDRDELNRNYLDLELRSIKAQKLGNIRQTINKAKELNAKKRAPQSLATAEADLQTAEATIESDRHNMGAIDPSVNTAKASADFLMEVTEIAKQGSSEAVAIQLVQRKHLLDEKNAQLQEASNANSALASKASTLESTNEQLSSQNKEYMTKEQFNQVITDAQEKFNSDEAEVYRVGDKLLIRLKKVQFPSGKADLPKASLDTLSKVKDVIALVGAEQVVVEGHTDSIGGKQQNMALSEQRAETVAEYLESTISKEKIEAVGYGFQKPLTSNKTKAGRAQNRRVDVLITPSAAH